jgi:cytidine deaminase
MEKENLIRLATEARTRAYAPYSSFSVGAALVAADGRTFAGCNVENVSFGLTICAERVAIGCALVAGSRLFEAIAIVSDSTDPVVPCGACRQVLAEFAPDLRIICATINGVVTEFDLGTLLPSPRQGMLG